MSPDTPKKRSNPRANTVEISTASFVVVANRLPVDRVENPDGSVDWRTSPGGLVTAFEPVMRMRQGAWVGWHGAADEELAPFRHNDLELVPVPVSALEIEEYYEGFSNATLWPLYHDVDRHARCSTGSGGTPTSRSTGGSPRRPPRSPSTARVVWVQDYQLQLVPQMLRDAATGPADRLLPAHSVPADRTLHAAAVAQSDPRGPARRRPGRVPAARRRPELRPAGPPAARLARPGGTDPTPDGRERARRRVPDLDRRAELHAAGQTDRRSGARPSRSGTISATRRCCSWASTGWTTPRASRSGSARTASCWPRAAIDARGRGDRPGRHARRGNGSTSYRRLRDEIERAGRPDQRRHTAGSAARRSLPAHRPSPGGAGRALPRRRRHGRHPAARRDEPGRQGVRRLPRRTTRARWCSASSPARPRSCGRPTW